MKEKRIEKTLEINNNRIKTFRIKKNVKKC